MGKALTSTLSIMMNLVLLNVAVFLSTLSLHEIGHVIVGMYSGCESGRAILFDSAQPGPYAELMCPDRVDERLALGGSFLATAVFGSLFLFLRKSPERNLFFIIIGFGIFFGSIDIVMITGIEMMQYVFIGFGMLLIIIGEFLTGLAYAETRTF